MHRAYKCLFASLIAVAIFLYMLIFFSFDSQPLEKNVLIEDFVEGNYRNFIPKDANLSCKFIQQKNYSHYSVNISGVTYPKFVIPYLNNSYNFKCINKFNSDRKKLILYWTTRFGRKNFSYGIGNGDLFKRYKCPLYNCETTNDRSRLNESDLILFHMRDRIDSLPKLRRTSQRWIFVLDESQMHSDSFTEYNGLFNLTSTFKLDSNFTSVYYTDSYLHWEENKSFQVDKDFSAGKTEFAFALISNCDDNSDRLYYINELKKHIPVEIYGKCGKKCPKAYVNGTEGVCKAILSEKYKFYLAFENSMCKDYITEKFFGSLRYDVLPVVFGSGNYDYYVPREAYVDTREFKSPLDLANHLIFLDRDKDAYNSHFKWKRFVKFKYGFGESRFCEFCLMLNLDAVLPRQRNVIKDFKHIWNRKKECKSKRSFLNKFLF